MCTGRRWAGTTLIPSFDSGMLNTVPKGGKASAAEVGGGWGKLLKCENDTEGVSCLPCVNEASLVSSYCPSCIAAGKHGSLCYGAVWSLAHQLRKNKQLASSAAQCISVFGLQGLKLWEIKSLCDQLLTFRQRASLQMQHTGEAANRNSAQSLFIFCKTQNYSNFLSKVLQENLKRRIFQTPTNKTSCDKLKKSEISSYFKNTV